MNLALRDYKIYQMKAELENRKKFLCSKKIQLKSTQKENNLLSDVLRDYEQYNNHLINQKQKQIQFLTMLNEYIENITKDIKLTDIKLKESKLEQRDILKEIAALKTEIDTLVENSDDNMYSNEVI